MPRPEPRTTLSNLARASRAGGVLVLAALLAAGCGDAPESETTATQAAPEVVAEAGVATHTETTAAPLPAVSAPPGIPGLEGSTASAPELREPIEGVLRRYVSAFDRRDIDALADVWEMGAVERALIERAWESCDEIDLSLEVVDVDRADAGPGANVAFDQELTFRCPKDQRTSTSKLEAALDTSSDGQWRIAEIRDRGTSPASLAPPRSTAPLDPSADQRKAQALATLAEYESALQRCDLDGLSRVWIMSTLERQMLQGLCLREGRLDASVTEPRVSTERGKVSVDFTHNVAYRGRTGLKETHSRMTALMVQRADGDWTIWKIRAAR